LSYTVIENFLPDAIQNMLEQQFQYHTEWNYVSETSGNTKEATDALDENVIECPQLCHLSHWGGEDNLKSFGLTRMVLYFIENLTGVMIKDVNKIKTNMNLLDTRFGPDKYHPPHADHRSPEYTSMVYYINDSDGPTRFFDKTTLDRDPYKDLKCVGEVHPKKGRAVLFSSALMHTGTCPQKHENRLVINFVFKAPGLKLPFDPVDKVKVENFA
tara:strand:+ start:2124 stop:2765 length:642 start_codon:yes stop_codon:yes gene_type:complete